MPAAYVCAPAGEQPWVVPSDLVRCSGCGVSCWASSDPRATRLRAGCETLCVACLLVRAGAAGARR